MRVKETREMKVIQGGNQMSLIRDTEEVVKFLEFASRKNILSEQAINCRLTACHNIFSVLNEEEDNLDYILGNLDILINRFRNKNNNVRASTLKVYKSRVKSSLEDFKSWSADPFAWERAVTEKAKQIANEPRKERKAAKPAVAKTVKKAEEEVSLSDSEEGTEIISTHRLKNANRVTFPIRKDFSIEVVLPSAGITLKELHRIGLFLYPYCTDLDPETIQWPTLPH